MNIALPKILCYKKHINLNEYSQIIVAEDIDKITEKILTRLRINSDDYDAVASVYTYTALQYYYDMRLRGVHNKTYNLNIGEVEYFACYIIKTIRGK